MGRPGPKKPQEFGVEFQRAATESCSRGLTRSPTSVR